MRIIFGALMAVILAVSGLEAGVVMTSVYETQSNPEENMKNKTYIDRDRMRVEISGTQSNQILIFRKDRQVFWIIDREQKTVIEMTKEDIKKMNKKMEEAMSMVDAQMKNMSPEQRKMMEQMMKGRMGQGPAQQARSETVYKKAGSGIKVNRWVCDRYEGYRQGERVKEVWTADWKQLKLKKEDFEIMNDLRDFVKELSRRGQSSSFYNFSEGGLDGKGFSGVPVKMIDYSQGRVHGRMEVKDIRQESMKADLFEVPAGLEKIRLADMERGVR